MDFNSFWATAFTLETWNVECIRRGLGIHKHTITKLNTLVIRNGLMNQLSTLNGRSPVESHTCWSTWYRGASKTSLVHSHFIAMNRTQQRRSGSSPGPITSLNRGSSWRHTNLFFLRQEQAWLVPVHHLEQSQPGGRGWHRIVCILNHDQILDPRRELPGAQTPEPFLQHFIQSLCLAARLMMKASGEAGEDT